MRSTYPLRVLPLIALGCTATQNAPSIPAQTTPAAAAQQEATALASGLVIPTDYDEVSLWPEAYAGDLFVLEVVPHGTEVERNQVIARLDTRTYEEQLEAAELDHRSALVEHANLAERGLISEEKARLAFRQANAALDRSKRSLAGYLSRELEFAQRADAISKAGEVHWIEDQVDELNQLEAMYNADELTDATEEIVLKRSRRDLSLTRERTALAEDRRKYRNHLADALERDRRQAAVAKQEQDFNHLKRSQDIERKSRANAERKSQAGLDKKRERVDRLKRDGALFELRAPRAGVLLHGKPRDYRSGTAQAVRRGNRLTARSTAFIVADPSQAAIAVSISESKLPKLPSGSTVAVKPLAGDEELSGTLTVDRYPASSKGKESTFAGTIALEQAGPLTIGMHVKVDVQP